MSDYIPKDCIEPGVRVIEETDTFWDMVARVVGGTVTGFFLGGAVGFAASLWCFANYAKAPAWEMDAIEAVLLFPFSCVVGTFAGAFGGIVGKVLKGIRGVLVSAFICVVSLLLLISPFAHERFSAQVAFIVLVVSAACCGALGAANPLRRSLATRKSCIMAIFIVPAFIGVFMVLMSPLRALVCILLLGAVILSIIVLIPKRASKNEEKP